jgi:hypothetical protein
VAQGVENQPSNCKALSLNAGYGNKKKR